MMTNKTLDLTIITGLILLAGLLGITTYHLSDLFFYLCVYNCGVALNELLKELGYTTEPAGRGKKHIIKDGKTVFTGDAGSVWEWITNGKRGES